MTGRSAFDIDADNAGAPCTRPALARPGSVLAACHSPSSEAIAIGATYPSVLLDSPTRGGKRWEWRAGYRNKKAHHAGYTGRIFSRNPAW